MSKPKIDDRIHDGWTADDVRNASRVSVVPVLAPEAFHGLAGKITRTIAPHTEADPAAVLAHVLVGVGNLLGRGPHALVEKTEHGCGEFVVLVGDTSKGRKGQAWSTPRYLLGQVDPQWAATRIKHGLSSGEGLIFNVRDARMGVDKKGQPVLEDEGECDKRLLIFEPELATVLRRMRGETNSLSAVLREAWECGDLSTLTKNSPLRATGAHVSIVAHTTTEELMATLTETDRANGFGNRFVYFLVRRSKCLPRPTAPEPAVLAPLVAELRTVAHHVHGVIDYDTSALALWEAVYPDLSKGEGGLVGAILARAEAHVLRLSVIYAALDRSPVIRVEHLRAALAVWDYCDKSARAIFGDVLGLTVADATLHALRKHGAMTRTQIRDLFKRNKSATEIDSALYVLAKNGKATCSMHPPEGGVGRSVETWEATTETT